MPREMSCPRGHKLQVSDAHLGQEVRCPTCGVSFVAVDPDAGGGGAEAPQIVPQGGTGMAALRARLGLGGGWSPFSLGVGRPVLMVGLLLVLLARGCDTVGRRSVQRSSAKLELAKSAFDDEYQGKQISLQQDLALADEEIAQIQKKTERSDADNARIEQLREVRSKTQEKLSDLREEQQKKRQALEWTTWLTLQIAARDAQVENQLSAYWREMLFVFGSIVLAFGLLVVSWSAEGAERWICLMMLAIITFSLYVGGIAWIPGIPIR